MFGVAVVGDDDDGGASEIRLVADAVRIPLLSCAVLLVVFTASVCDEF